MNKKNTIISCVAFVVTGVVGFGVTKLVGGSSEPVIAPHVDVDPHPSPDIIVPEPPEPPEPSEPSEPVKITTAEKKETQMTAAELTRIINGSSNDYPRSITIHIVGNNVNEQATSIAMIRQYKNMGTWSNITVTNVEYDKANSNRVRAITVSVVSNGSDSEE